jgi:hypothetical protein
MKMERDERRDLNTTAHDIFYDVAGGNEHPFVVHIEARPYNPATSVQIVGNEREGVSDRIWERPLLTHAIEKPRIGIGLSTKPFRG